MEQTAINPVVVHGGGPQIGDMLKRLGIESHFAGGLRVTDEKTIEIVEMVLAGSINKQLVGFINAAGGKAIGLTGKDGNMVIARKANRTVVDPSSKIEEVVDLGFVGEPDKVDMTVLNEVLGRQAHSGAGTGRRFERWRHLQRQCRYVRRRDRRRIARQALPAAHRRARRARQVQEL